MEVAVGLTRSWFAASDGGGARPPAVVAAGIWPPPTAVEGVRTAAHYVAATLKLLLTAAQAARTLKQGDVVRPSWVEPGRPLARVPDVLSHARSWECAPAPKHTRTHTHTHTHTPT